MAKKSSNGNTGLAKIAGFFAFLALLIAGLTFLINWILTLFDGGASLGWLGKIGSVSLVISVFLSAWNFIQTTKLPGSKLVWQVLFLILAVLAIVGVVAI